MPFFYLLYLAKGAYFHYRGVFLPSGIFQSVFTSGFRGKSGAMIV